MKESNNLKKDIILIFLGAFISSGTALTTTFINEKRYDKKENVKKKIELNNQISKDLGKRLYLTYQLYKSIDKNDTVYINALKDYKISKEEWNIQIYSYQSLLKYYYSEKIKKEFLDSIYTPLVELGQQAEHRKLNKSFKNKFKIQQTKNIEFITKVYDLSNE
ncbi:MULTISPECIES: hypothetical protein [unclassified Chryseobacterium]|uniref:hypothetical protein n=1 Tax=unclassified Chryseobacterium TaxID=2593645 RepID=UPI0030176C30